MERLDPHNSLFKELYNQNPEWWRTLKEDKEIYIDVRKDNEIDAYYNGGSIIRKLKHNGSRFTGEIHYKYLLPEKAEYIQYDFSDNDLRLKKDIIEFTTWDDFKDALPRIKANMRQHYAASSEKGIQARFVLNSPQFLDTELEKKFKHKGEDVIARIDLIWLDTNNKLIIPTELKTIADPRVYNGEIVKQLEKYADFMEQYKSDIMAYYTRLFGIKQKLGLLPSGLSSVDSLEGYDLIKLPLLIFGDCNQLWINKISPDLDSQIKHCAVGSYYFGGTNDRDCSLVKKTVRNKHIF